MKTMGWWVLVCLCTSTALGAPTAEDLAAYKDAGARLSALVDTAQQQKAVPGQLKTPEVMRLVQVLSDERRMLRTDTYPASEMGTLLDTCDVANKAEMSFVLFNLKSRIDPAASQQQAAAAMVALMNDNVVTFQDELKALQPFLLRCLAKEISPMVEFVSKLKPEELTDVRRQGLARARSGLLQIYSGALQTVSDTRCREDFRLAILDVLGETSGQFATVMELPVRKQLQGSMSAAASKAAEPYKGRFTRIAASLEGDACNSLCAIH